jgi:integrase
MRIQSVSRDKKRSEKHAAPYVVRSIPHVELRHKTYYAVLDIPTKAQHAFEGRTKLVMSLKTDSPDKAQKRAAPTLARWRREIDKAKGEHVETDAEFFRRTLTAAELATIRTLETLELSDGRKIWVDKDTGETVKDTAEPAEPGASITFRDGKSRTYKHNSSSHEVSGAGAFDHLIAEWRGAISVTQKTKDMYEADVKEFAAKFRTVARIDKAGVKRWVGDMIADGITAKTMQRKLSALRDYWRHLQSVNVAPEDLEPFHALNISTGGGRVKREDKRQPFEPRGVVKLLDAAREREDSELADLIDLDRWTGMRIEEACSLRVEDAKLTAKVPHFTINAGKTDAAIREVPIHPRLLPVVKRLVKDSKDGYLLSGQPENKYGDRSNALGKRFGRLKTDLGFGENYVFHSIRGTVATQFENATPAIPENVAADIIGHDKPTMTYGLYSGGTSLAVKYEAVKKLSYPARVAAAAE